MGITSRSSVIICLGLLARLSAAESQTGKRDATIAPEQAAHLTVEPATARPFQATTVAVGRITFNEDRTTPVFAQFSGHAARLVVKPGDRVEKGDVLLELDCPDLVQAESDLWAAMPQVAKCEALLEHARRTAERIQRLYKGQAAALRDLEQAQADVTTAGIDLTAAQATRTAMRDRLHIFGKNDADIATIEQGHVVVRTLAVTAPIAGTVTARKVGPGQYVRTDAAEPLFTITDLSSLWLQAEVYEADAQSVALGQEVKVTLAALSGAAISARIAYIAPAVDPATHRLAVRCELDHPPAVLKADMLAGFTIATSTTTAVPAVPASALVRTGDQQAVWVARSDTSFERHLVTTGLRQDGLVQIIAGITAGDRVVSKGGVFLESN